MSELARWDALAVIGDVDERGGRPQSVDANPDLPPAPGVGAVFAMQVADVDIDDAFITDPGGVPDLGDHALPRVRAVPSTP